MNPVHVNSCWAEAGVVGSWIDETLAERTDLGISEFLLYRKFPGQGQELHLEAEALVH